MCLSLLGRGCWSKRSFPLADLHFQRLTTTRRSAPRQGLLLSVPSGLTCSADAARPGRKVFLLPTSNFGTSEPREEEQSGGYRQAAQTTSSTSYPNNASSNTNYPSPCPSSCRHLHTSCMNVPRGAPSSRSPRLRRLEARSHPSATPLKRLATLSAWSSSCPSAHSKVQSMLCKDAWTSQRVRCDDDRRLRSTCSQTHPVLP